MEHFELHRVLISQHKIKSQWYFRNTIFHKEECPKDIKNQTRFFNMRREYSYRKMKESVTRFSEKNEVFFELYVRSPFLYFFFFHLFTPLTTIYDISLYVRALLLYISLSSVFSRTTQIYYLFNILQSVSVRALIRSPISWLTWHNFGYQTGITRAIAVAPVRTILNRRVGLGSVSVGRRSVGSLSLAGSLGTEILLAVLRTTRVKICRPLYEKTSALPRSAIHLDGNKR